MTSDSRYGYKEVFNMMKITSYRNNPPRDGRVAIALGIFFILLVQFYDPIGTNPDSEYEIGSPETG